VDTLEKLLDPVEQMLERGWQEEFDEAVVEPLGEQLRTLHSRLRAHDAAQHLATGQQIAEAPPQHAEDLRRLLAEHINFMGMLDRLNRAVAALPALPLEDKEVFYLRGRELIAALRRHEAEEDRLFFISLWHDTGGES
jgi:hypothetical protein